MKNELEYYKKRIAREQENARIDAMRQLQERGIAFAGTGIGLPITEGSAIYMVPQKGYGPPTPWEFEHQQQRRRVRILADEEGWIP